MNRNLKFAIMFAILMVFNVSVAIYEYLLNDWIETALYGGVGILMALCLWASGTGYLEERKKNTAERGAA